MSDYIGTREQVDEYVGSRLVEAAYLGSRKYFDAYSEITGSLPLSFLSKGEALTDYRIYGTANGAGVATENLFDKNITEGIEDNYYINKTTGNKVSNAQYYISAPIAVTSEEKYWWVFRITSDGPNHSVPTVGFFDANDNQIGVASHSDGIKSFTFTTPANCAYVRASVYKYDINEAMLVKASTAPVTYIPYGYQIPILISGEEAQQSNYDLFIGDSKLGEEEHVDYGEQKVYKRTEQLFNKDTITRGINVSATSIYESNAAGCSDYIEVTPGEDYYFNRVRGTGAYYTCVEYDLNKSPLRNRTLSGPTVSGVITMNADAYYIRVNITLSLLSSVYVCSGTKPLETIPPYYIPTDPPAPFPAITAYQGENTLSSTETLGEATIKGRINELPTQQSDN